MFNTRPNTTDQQVIKEVIKNKCYLKKGITIESTDVWLDLGANIGTFTVQAALLGAKVIAFEPEPENYKLLLENISLNKVEDRVISHQAAISMKTGTSDLYLGSSEYQKYTHTLFRIRGRNSIPVKTCNIQDYLGLVNAVKMDIEGTEIEILESIDDWKVKKLVFEYSFNRDRSIGRFNAIIDKLRRSYTVNFKKMPDSETYDYFPSGVLVYCLLK